MRLDIVFRILLSLGVSILILALILSLFLSEGENVSRARLWALFKNISFILLLPYILCQIGQTFFRALRYRVLLLEGGGIPLPGMGRMFLVTAARNMFVDMIPARVGELSYVAMLNRGYRVPAHLCLSSLTVSVFFDFFALLTIVGMMILQALFFTRIEGWMWTTLMGLTLLIALGSAFLIYGIPYAIRLKGFMDLKILKNVWLRRGFDLLQSFGDALQETLRAGLFWKLMGLSLLVRGLKYTGLYFTFLAVVGANFPEFASLPFQSILAALLGSEAGASIPVPTFMSFGTYEAGGALALTLLGFSAESSALGLLTMHICSQLVDYSIGAAALLIFVMTVGKSKEPTPSSPSRWKKYGFFSAAILFFGIGALLLNLRDLKKSGVLESQPESGQEEQVGKESLNQIRELLGNRTGFLVWSSNRHGNHDILRMSLPDMKIAALTRHPHTEYFPRISPDGQKIVFARSKIPWVSQRDLLSWEVWVLDLKTGEERQITESGNVPTWSADGKKVHFQRNGRQFVAHELETATEEILFESGKNGIPAGLDLQTPDYDENRKQMAVTFRGKKQATMICSTHNTPEQIAGGCQLTWAPDSQWLYYVDKAVDPKQAFYRVDFQTRKKELLLDLPLPYSHEYFPKISNDGAFLVCGASTGGHEHDQADYEIFIWKLSTSREEAARLTFHTGNDCWPDLHLE